MSNTQATVEDLIDELTDVLEKGWHLPFAGGKSFIDSEDAKQILDEIREAIPSEVRKAKAIVADRAQIISEAQREAETIVRVAEEKAKALVNQEEIVRQAQAKANDHHGADAGEVPQHAEGLQRLCGRSAPPHRRRDERQPCRAEKDPPVHPRHERTAVI